MNPDASPYGVCRTGFCAAGFAARLLSVEAVHAMRMGRF
jgi:hypothetical protein